MSLTTRTSEIIHLYPQYIGKTGVVQDFTTNGDVVVEYRDIRWRYNPAVLSNNFFFTQIQKFKQGDKVVVKSDENLVKELQKEHGGWNESMISVSFIIFLNFLLRKLLCACAEAKNVN